MFSDPQALLWLAVALVATVILVYGPLFWLFFGFCRLDGPSAIRLAWTVGLACLIVILAGLSPVHREFLAFWDGHPERLPIFLALALPALVFLTLIWATKPRLEG